MPKTEKSYKVGSEHTVTGIGKGKVIKKKCHQCRKTSIARVPKTGNAGPWDVCLNGCGPERLSKLFSL